MSSNCPHIQIEGKYCLDCGEVFTEHRDDQGRGYWLPEDLSKLASLNRETLAPELENVVKELLSEPHVLQPRHVRLRNAERLLDALFSREANT
jgi:hypothetical protein